MSFFLNSLRFFYTNSSLIKGQVSERRRIQLAFSSRESLFFAVFSPFTLRWLYPRHSDKRLARLIILSCFYSLLYLQISGTRGFPSTPHCSPKCYLDISSFLFLIEFGTRVYLVRSEMVSEKSYYHDFSSLFYLHESGTKAFFVSSQLVSKVSYYLHFSYLLHLPVWGTSAFLLRSALVSKVSLYLDFSSLFYLPESHTRSSLGIVLSQSYFSSFIVLYIDRTTSCPSNM